MAVHEPARVAWRSYHDWVLPRRAVLAVLTASLLFLVLGFLLLAVGGGLGVGGLVATGAVLAGIGGCGILVCLMLCLHAYFIFNVRDEAVQTGESPWSDDISPHEIPGYAVISKPSALKSADSLRRNGGGGGGKKVTMAPDVALDADRAPGIRTSAPSDPAHAQFGRFSPTLASPSTPGYRTVGNYAVIDTPTSPSPMHSYDQRSFAQQQQFQNLQQLQQQAAQRQQAHTVQSLQQQQQADMDIQQQRQQLEMHRQHLLQQQQQQHQHQQQHFRVQSQQQQQQTPSVTYAQIQRAPIAVQHSPSPSLGSQQSSSVVSNFGSSVGGGGGVVVGGGMGGGSGLQGGQTSGAYSYKIQTQGLQYQSGRPYMVDDDYDNPVERTPMLSQRSAAASSSSSAMSASAASSRVVGGASSGGGSRVQSAEEVPEPSPLVYPSARRPMTFEQQSSSKMSIYDNVLFPYSEADDE